MKKTVLLLIAILFVQTLFSQENYLSGYVIKPDGDTIFGLVDYKNWGYNPNRIKFRTESESNPVIYKPTDIIEFSVNNEKYISGIIDSETSPTRAAQLTEDPTINLVAVTAFVQAIVQGDKGLYYYKDNKGKENFYIKQDGTFELLVHKKYLKIQDRKKVIVDNNRFIGQLAIYLNDCSSIQSKLNKTTYSWKSLNNLFQFYYKCSQSGPVFQVKKEKVSTEFGALAGVTLSSLKFRSDYFTYLVEAEYDQSVNFAAGVFFDIILPRNQRKWSISNELIYSSYQVNGHYLVYENENRYTKISTEIGCAYLKMNNMARFTYPIGDLYVFVNAGITNDFVMSETNYKKKEYKSGEQFVVQEDKALEGTRKLEQGFIFGSGVKYTKYSIEVRYERANSMAKYTNLNSTMNRFYFLLKYRF
jgi:hypothetical protein